MTCSHYVAMHGHRLSNQEVRASNDAWSAPDRARITAALNAVSDAVCVRPPSAGHTGTWTSDKRVLVICLGYLLWPGSRVPKDLLPAMDRPCSRTCKRTSATRRTNCPLSGHTTAAPRMRSKPQRSVSPARWHCLEPGAATPATDLGDYNQTLKYRGKSANCSTVDQAPPTLTGLRDPDGARADPI